MRMHRSIKRILYSLLLLNPVALTHAQTGETLDTSGVKLQRITWERVRAAQVRQLWESSRDGGKTWTVVFDGRYLRRRR